MPGAGDLEDAWLRARLGEDGYLGGKDAETAACDAQTVPVVRTRIGTTPVLASWNCRVRNPSVTDAPSAAVAYLPGQAGPAPAGPPPGPAGPTTLVGYLILRQAVRCSTGDTEAA
jgi:hypothetical protein